MNPDRLLVPELITPLTLPVIRARKILLDNGLSTYVVDAGTESVVKLDIIYPSGTTGFANFTIASAAHQLIDAGTSQKKAIDIAEGFDFYGSYLQTDFGPDWKTLSLFSLSRFFRDSLSGLIEILDDAIYPEEELENWKTRSIQSVKVNREKVSWLARKTFNETLYTTAHPYGITTVEDDIEKLTAGNIRNFYRENYQVDKAIIIISGKIDADVIKALNETFGKMPVKSLNIKTISAPGSFNSKPAKVIIDKKDAVQSGIRIGKVLFSKTHPDYPAIQIVNTILGGYFGSRLMSNIREDKGYTYGIGSGVQPQLTSSYFYISTEVGAAVREAAITEIYSELRRLTLEPVPESELRLVKNYLIGSFQRSLDGPFSLADRFRGIHLFGLDYEYLDSYFRLIHSISPEMVMEIASKHLQPDSMTEIIAG